MDRKHVETDGEVFGVHLSFSSHLIKDMLSAMMSREYKETCMFAESPNEEATRGMPLILISDWRDLINRKTVARQSKARETTFTHPEIHVIVNMARGEEDRIPAFLDRRKVRGLFYAEESLDTFMKGLRRILNGEIWIPRTVMIGWMDPPVAENPLPAKNHLLSSRQVSILKFIAQGMSNMEIAKTLGISSNTVKAHIYNIFKLISVTNRVQAAQWAASCLDEGPVWLRN